MKSQSHQKNKLEYVQCLVPTKRLTHRLLARPFYSPCQSTAVGRVVIISEREREGANPDLIKEIQLTVLVAREYLTAITAAQILADTQSHHITYYCYCQLRPSSG